MSDGDYIGIAPIKSSEPGDHLKVFCKILTALVELKLGEQSEFVVLERSELQRLTAEHQLSGGNLDIIGATKLFEFGVRRNDAGKGLMVTCRMQTPGATATVFEIPLEAVDAIHARNVIVEGLVQKVLENPTSIKLVSPEAEAKIFDQRLKLFRSAYSNESAIEMAEAALALSPTRERYEATINAYGSWLHEYTNQSKSHPQSQDLQQRVEQLRLERFEYILKHEELRIRWAFSEFNPATFPNFPDTAQRIRTELRQRTQSDLDTALANTVGNPRHRFEVLIGYLEFLPKLTETDEEYFKALPVLFADFEKVIESANIPDDVSNHSYERFIHHLMGNLSRIYNRKNFAQTTSKPLPDVSAFLGKLDKSPRLCLRMASLFGQMALPHDQGAKAAVALLAEYRNAPDSLKKTNLIGEHARRIARERVVGSSFEENYLADLVQRATESKNLSELNDHLYILRTFAYRSKGPQNKLGVALLAALNTSEELNSELEGLRRGVEDHLRNAGVLAKKEFSLANADGPWTQYIARPIRLTNLDRDHHQLLSIQVVPSIE